jgi:hypothetical protein
MIHMTTETNDKPATVAEQGAHVAPEKSPSKKGASKKKSAPKAKKSAKAATPKKAAKAPQGRAPKRAAEERTNKKAEVIAMMKRAKGATLAEIVEATNWQKHTVRGFVSILGSKGGEKIESSKNAAGERGLPHCQVASLHDPPTPLPVPAGGGVAAFVWLTRLTFAAREVRPLPSPGPGPVQHWADDDSQ